MVDKFRLGIAGLGTVGSALVRTLDTNKKALETQLGRALEMKVLSARSARDFNFAHDFTTDPLTLIAREDIDLVVELMGGGDGDGIAYQLVKGALKAGKHVVTANKALLAAHGLELAALAEQHGVALNYEAAIAGGVPIVKTLRESLSGDDIFSIKGILNGTSNYILCQMADVGMSFDAALAQAQSLGYAEADPRFDIHGDDAAHKLKLLIYLAFGVEVATIPKQGIDKIEQLDMKMAHDLSYSIRLLAQAQKTEKGISASVEPALVALGTKLSQSSGTDNMIGILTNKRHLFLEGEGAGAEPTAASVIADIVDVARGQVLPPFAMKVKHMRREKITAADLPSAFYIRVFLADRAGSMAVLTNIMAQHAISLSGISQPPMDKGDADELAAVVFITHPIERAQVNKAIAALGRLDQVISKPLAIKIET